MALEKIIKLTRSSEKKFKQGNFKESIEDKRKVYLILESESEEEIINKFREELSNLYSSKFDLINDHKLRIDQSKINEIINLLKKQSEEKYMRGNYKAAVKALRRSEKYFSNNLS